MTDEKPKYVIEKGIPMPTYGCDKYKFGEMEVGDSFPAEYSPANINRIRSASFHFGTRMGRNRKFSTKIVIEKDEKLIRIWRIK